MRISLVTSILFLSFISGFSQAAEISGAEEKALIRDANIALAQKDYATAFAKYSTLAEYGKPLAQFNLGAFYLNGQGVQKNERLAYEWFRKSAAQGDARALNVIENAAAKGNLYAMDELNILHEQTVAVQPQQQPQQDPVIQPQRNTNTSGSARADSGMHFLFNLGVTFGGDSIFTATTTTGEERSVKGGGLLQLGIGGLYQFKNTPMALALSANYHMDRVSASNGEMYFRRYPIEALAYYTGANSFRVGGGVRIVTSPESSATINSSTQKITFDNTIGYVAEMGVKTSPNSWINLRYVSEKYQGKTFTATNGTTTSLDGGSPVDGSHFGLFIVFEI